MYRESSAHQFSHRQKSIFLVLVGIGMLLIGLISGVAMMAKGWLPLNTSGNKIPALLASGQPIDSQATLNLGFSAVAKSVTPAVATVETPARVKPQPCPFSRNPCMDSF